MADRKIFANQGPTDPNLKKSKFDLSKNNNGTYRFGRMYPVYVKEAAAGSSFDIRADFAYDVDPLIYPMQSPVHAHLSFYKVPMRILQKSFRNFFAQIGSDGEINGANSYSIPFIKRSSWVKEGSLADYMGLPTTKIVELPQTIGIAGLHPNFPIFEDGLIVGERALGEWYIQKFGTTPYISLVIPKGYKLRTDAVNQTGTIYTSFVTAAEPDVSTLQDNLDLYNEDIYAFVDLLKLEHIMGGIDYSYEALTLNNISTGRVDAWSVGTPVESSHNGTSYWTTPLYATLSDSFIADINKHTPYQDVLILIPVGIPSLLGVILRPVGNPAGMETLTAVGDKDDLPISDASEVTIKPYVPNYGHKQFFANVSRFTAQSIETTHFDSIGGADPVLPVSALPFRAYEFIYRYFYANTRVTPFMKNNKPCYDEFITNDGDGADDTTPVDFFHAPYEYDMFTTCVPTPFFGNAPLVGVTTNSATESVFEMRDVDSESPDYGSTYKFGVKTTETGKITGITFVDGNGKTSTLDVMNQAIEYGISIADFRNVNALTRFQERHMKAGTKFQNLCFEFYGCSPDLGVEYPEYIGGMTRTINVNKITNTAQSEGNPLGDFAGTANFEGHSEAIKCFCSEPCYIMGILYFTVTPTYPQQLPLHFLKSKLLDFYNPLFANISPQPVFKKQIAPLQLDAEHVNDVFGYNRPYADYVSDSDEVHGEFRSSRSQFLCQRLFAECPSLNERFLTVHSNDLTDVFANQMDTDHIYGMIHFDVEATLPIPRYSIPQII